MIVLASVTVLVVHYILIYLSSETKIAVSNLQKRGDFLPERAFLVTFALATLFRSQSGGNGLDIIIAIGGLSYCTHRCFARRSILDYRLKYLNGLLYLTGLWLFLSYYISRIFLNLGVPIRKPLLLFLLGFIVLGVTSYFLRPRLKLKSVALSSYGYQEQDRFLQNIETLTEAYRLSTQKEAQSTLMILMKYVEDEKKTQEKSFGARSEPEKIFSFSEIS